MVAARRSLTTWRMRSSMEPCTVVKDAEVKDAKGIHGVPYNVCCDADQRPRIGSGRCMTTRKPSCIALHTQVSTKVSILQSPRTGTKNRTTRTDRCWPMRQARPMALQGGERKKDRKTDARFARYVRCYVQGGGGTGTKPGRNRVEALRLGWGGPAVVGSRP